MGIRRIFLREMDLLNTALPGLDIQRSIALVVHVITIIFFFIWLDPTNVFMDDLQESDDEEITYPELVVLSIWSGVLLSMVIRYFLGVYLSRSIDVIADGYDLNSTAKDGPGNMTRG